MNILIVEAMALGTTNYISKQYDIEKLMKILGGFEKENGA